jgi:hypothetical protein
MEPVRFGVIGTARIAMQKVIPAMQRSAHCSIVAIASRDLTRAQAAAQALGIPRAHGSYTDLLRDPAIEAAAGKHLLCEKPIARALVRGGRIGALRVVQGSFSYMNVDPANVRPRCAGCSATPRRAAAATARTQRERTRADLKPAEFR